MSARRALLLALAAVSAAALWSVRARPDRAVLPAVEVDDFTALSGRSAESTPELWERLKAMGVAAAVLREESAAELAGRGDAMHFSRGEVDKWRALGLVAESAGPRPDSLWAKDAKALARLSSALAARGIDVSTAIAAGGVRVIELPPGVDLARVPAGFDPESVAVVSSAGLIPVAASTSSVAMVAGRRFWIRSLQVSARRPQLLRAAHGRALRLLILRPAPGAGLEETVESMRAALKVVRGAGVASVLSAVAPPAPVGGAAKYARLFLFFAAGLFGPLLAARTGLSVAQSVRSWTLSRAPIASPVPETLAGVAASWAAATAAGLFAVAAATPECREAFSRSWTLWTLSAAPAVGAAALFGSEGPALRWRWRAPVRVRDLAAALVIVVVAGAMLAPRSALHAAGLWESADRLSAAADLLWWWPWRWREILIGVPCLVLTFILVGRRGEHDAPRFLGDPRGWLIPGLLAPAGTIAAIAGGDVPLELSVAHGAYAALLGAAFGFAVSALRTRVESWVLRPRHAGLLT
ncbi:MAG: hypothetical protein HY923_08175 [Elusimicrobia bacterium]|nr:hypothetical protein [Elusimicrobiota bacterium]